MRLLVDGYRSRDGRALEGKTVSLTTLGAQDSIANESNRKERAPRSLTRAFALVAHRYVGLAIAVFLAVAGITGSALTFVHELDAVINPGLLRVRPPLRSTLPLAPTVLRESLLRQLPTGSLVDMVPLDVHPGQAATFFATIAATTSVKPDDQFFVDPYTGALLGSRRYGDLSQGLRNLMPFVYQLHYSLALGTVGSYLMGIVALLWTADCFVGAYLTMPVRPKRLHGKHSKRAWIWRWMPAWFVRTSKLFSLVFTWHRASGLWLWALLLVFGWSAVAMNLREVYNPAMRSLFEMRPNAYETLPIRAKRRAHNKLGWSEAHKVGQALMAAKTAEQRIRVIRERRMRYDAARGAFSYQVRSTGDVSARLATTTVWFDGDTGRLLAFESPTGQQMGNTLTSWLYGLHFADVAVLGILYRILVCALGFAIGSLSVTGVWIWWKKRFKRPKNKRSSYRDPLSSASS